MYSRLVHAHWSSLKMNKQELENLPDEEIEVRGVLFPKVSLASQPLQCEGAGWRDYSHYHSFCECHLVTVLPGRHCVCVSCCSLNRLW